jgi:tetratricopeptide (TPR) repeat protein
MAESLEYIDNYFKQLLSPEERRRFEQMIAEDKDFAELVAFYIAAMQTVRAEGMEDKKERFRRLYESSRLTDGSIQLPQKRIPRWVPALAAAALIGLILAAWLLYSRPASPQKLADKYIVSHLQSLPVTLSGKEDSLQTGLRYYNEGQFTRALSPLEYVLSKDSTDPAALEYSGIVYLRQQNYDKALSDFRKLEENRTLYDNPGKFLHALTLMKRNRPGDAETAKDLLQQVVNEHLANREAAEDFLKKL